MTEEELQAEYPASVPEFTATQLEVADGSESTPSPTEDQSSPPATKGRSAAPRAQATEWVETNTKWS